MHIGYVINRDEILWLKDSMTIIAKQSRKDRLFRDNTKILLSQSNHCDRCGRQGGRLESHHVVPVWALATELILKSNPLSLADLWKTTFDCLQGFDFSEWHKVSNLKLLCPECHLIEQANSDRKFKIELCEKYNLVYSYTVLDGVYRKRHGKNPVTDIGEYLNTYIERQILDLRAQVKK